METAHYYSLKNKIHCGDMYMVGLDHSSKLYAWSVSRVWWKPWRYNLRFYYMRKYRVISGVKDLGDEVHRNLTYDGLVGTLKLFDLWRD